MMKDVKRNIEVERSKSKNVINVLHIHIIALYEKMREREYFGDKRHCTGS